MPDRAGEDQGVSPGGGEALDLLDGLGVDLLLHGLPFPVEGAHLPGHVLGPGGVVCEEEVRRQLRLPHAPGGVDPGGQDEADLGGGQARLRQARLPQEGPEAQKRGLPHRLQPPADDGAVLPGHEHHVRHRADGGQGAVALEEGLRLGLPQGQDQLEGHAHPGQVLEGVGAVAPAGVHHGHRLRQYLLALVVVGDDQVQSDLPREAGLLHAGDAAVDGDHQGHALVPEGPQCVPPQAVAVLDAAGDVLDAVRPLGAQVVDQEDGGGDAVHVVVAEDGHALPPLQGQTDAPDRLVHILHEEGGVLQMPLPDQEGPGFAGCLHAPGGHHGGEQAGVARRVEPLRRRLVKRRRVPLGVFHASSSPLPAAGRGPDRITL